MMMMMRGGGGYRSIVKVLQFSLYDRSIVGNNQGLSPRSIHIHGVKSGGCVMHDSLN
jgi:hypothetical protein